jgi:hypothetical protein
MSFSLTGCFKGNISVDVKWDGSADVGVAIGMTPQAQALVSASSQGVNPFQDIRKSLTDSSGIIPDGIRVKQWSEGDYSWMSATKNFTDFEQVNKVMDNKNLFTHFSLTRTFALIVDEYTLDAEMAPLATDTNSAGTKIDPTAFITMTISARLPGLILESNGFQDSNDHNLYTWTAEGYQAVPITIKSLSINLLGVFLLVILGGGIIGLGIYLFGGIDFLLHPKKTSVTPAPLDRSGSQPQRLEPLAYAPQLPDTMVELGIEDLLNQVNTHAINSTGEFHKRSREMVLAWKDATGRQRFIDIKDLGNHQITVNGKNYPATKDNAKAGIVEALKNQKEI